MIEGQEGVDWRLWKRLAETVEGLGFDAFWRSDHLYSVMGKFDRATIECWASLALIATWTKRIPFGPNVSPMTFREPGVLAKTAAAVDVLSDGRLVMGVGAGWYEAEHRDFGITFPPLRERMDRMDASFDIMRGVWEARNPRPVRGTIPFLVGGDGERRTLSAVARHADWWSIGIHRKPHEYRHKVEVLERHCGDVGRDPRDIRRGFQASFWSAARKRTCCGGQTVCAPSFRASEALRPSRCWLTYARTISAAGPRRSRRRCDRTSTWAWTSSGCSTSCSRTRRR